MATGKNTAMNEMHELGSNTKHQLHKKGAESAI